MQTVRQAEQELADYLVEHPELYQMQLSIDNALSKIGLNTGQRMLYLSKMMGHYCIDMLVEMKMLNHVYSKSGLKIP